MGSLVVFTCRKKITVAIKEATTAKVPKTPEPVLPNCFPKNTLDKNPTNGANNKSKTKLVSIRAYPFKFFKLSISTDPWFRKMETRIASPTATSAAATAIEKNTKTCPDAS